MIDIEATIREYLAEQTEISATFGKRIYAARSLPAGYTPDRGPGLLLNVRGGGQAFHSNLYTPSVQMRIYGKTEADVRAAANQLYEAINDTQSREFAYVRMQEGTLPSLLNEPGTNWPYVLCYYTFQVRNV